MLYKQIIPKHLIVGLSLIISGFLYADLPKGDQALLDAALQGSLENIERALQDGASINTKNEKKGATPLHLTIISENIDAVKLLLQKGAFVESKSNEGITALMLASTLKKTEILELLISAGANVTNSDSQGAKPLHFAAEGNAPHAVALLIKNGAHADGADNKGWTPLHHAVRYNAPDAIDSLIKHGADIAKTKYGMTPAMYAMIKLRPQALDAFERNGALNSYPKFIKPLMHMYAKYAFQSAIGVWLSVIAYLAVDIIRKNRAMALKTLQAGRLGMYVDGQRRNVWNPQ